MGGSSGNKGRHTRALSTETKMMMLGGRREVRGWDELTGELHFWVMRHSPRMIDIDVFSPLR